MFTDKTYSKALVGALILHVLLGFLLFFETHNSRPALAPEVKNEAGEPNVMDTTKPQDIVKAVSVDKSEVANAVNRLKAERAQIQKAEQLRQRSLAAEANKVRAERLKEQQKLQKLKAEAAQLAIKKQQELQKEQKRLEQLAKEKAEESKQLEALKKERLKQENEQRLNKIAVEKEKKEAAILEAKNAKLKAESQAKAELAKAEAEKKSEAAKHAAAKALEEKLQAQQAKSEAEAAAREAQAAQESQQRAKMAGEVDRYKALIINAISQRWILPDNVGPGLSSQFKIRLAPDGAVLEVSLLRSSGDPILDRSAQSAIYKASPLPVPQDPLVFDIFREISLTVRPENIRG